MHRSRIVLFVLLFIPSLLMAAEPQQLAAWDGSAAADKGVAMDLELVDPQAPKSELRFRFKALPEGLEQFHLYPPDAQAGVPLAISVQGLTTAGDLHSDAPTKMVNFADQQVKVYAVSAIEVSLPVYLPAEDTDVTLTMSYMACSDDGTCRLAQMNRSVQFTITGIGERAITPTDNGDTQQADPGTSDVQQQNQKAHKEIIKATGINWRHVSSVAEVEQLIDEAAANGETVYLDFTGPSCINCQDMAKNILVIPEVRAQWNSGIPVELNTDAHSELAQWQLEKFGTYARPMYVRIDPDGSHESWNLYFKAGNQERLMQLIDFLKGGSGQFTGSGDNWWQFALLALAGGLFTLLMPCTYPMIPLTVNFFNKQADAGRRLWPLALSYALGILISFTLLGVIVGVILGTAITNISGDPWVNLAIGLLFIVLGLSLLGVFFLRLPTGLSNALTRNEVGYLGALLMGLTFAITAFTCTAPFAGAVLAEGAKSGDVLRPTIGMLLYASVIAVPFFFLSMSPKMLQRLPKAGSWMNEFKIVGGIVEIAAAFKFIAISDYAWGWDMFGRSLCLSIWIVLSLFCAVYIMGLIRFSGDAALEQRGPLRLLLALAFAALGLWLASGLFGLTHLGLIESFFPGDAAPV